MLEEAVSKDIPWTQWNAWLRSKIIKHIKATNPEPTAAVSKRRRSTVSGSTLPHSPKSPNRKKRKVTADAPNVPATKFEEALALQKKLFSTTHKTVFAELEGDSKYTITEDIKRKFSAKKMYKKVLKKNLDFKKWQQWLRKRIVKELENTQARRRLTNQDLIDRFIRESIRCQNS